jgi:hypothetical protein
MKKLLPVLALLAGLGSSISFAQAAIPIIDCVVQRKLVVPRVRGQVFDPSGALVTGAIISLTQAGIPAKQSKTDAKGRFDLRVPSGLYVLKAEYPGFGVTTAELDVGKDAMSLFRSTTLKVILALPAMNCPWVTTSNKEFKELRQTHATQK